MASQFKCEFKLLLPLPESWHYQSNFRTPNDNSKTQLCHALNRCSHAHSISIVMAQSHWCRTLLMVKQILPSFVQKCSKARW